MLSVIFDMDGLMFATERLYILSWREAGKLHGWTLTDELCLEHTGVSLWRTREIMTNHLGPKFDFDAVYKDQAALVLKWIERDGMPIKPGLPELLTWLDEHGIKRAMATSSDRELLDRYVAHVRDAVLVRQIKGFNAIVTGEQIKNSKPAPDIFLEAARQIDADPRDCVVLEDSYNGIKAAHAANMYPVMVPDVLPPTPEILSLVHAKVDDLKSVIPVLEKLLKKR